MSQRILTEENVKEVREKLKCLDTAERLESFSEPPQEADSGISSRDMSRNTSGIDACDDITEKTWNVTGEEDTNRKETTDELMQCPVQIKILSEHHVDHEHSPLSSDLDHHLLSVSRPRKTSNSSTASDEYKTAPSSPIANQPILSRSLSIESTSSSSSSQDMLVRVEVNLLTTKEKFKVETKTKVKKMLNSLQINVSLQQCSLKHRRRIYSSPSAPNSPLPPKRNKTQLSFDQNSPPTSPSQNRKGCTKQRRKNYIIEHILQKNMVEFVKSTDLVSLQPHLFACGLVSKKDIEELNGINTSRGKNNFLYMFLLNSKGTDAYENFFDCLKEEKDHKGHVGLVKIIESGLRGVDQDEL